MKISSASSPMNQISSRLKDLDRASEAMEATLAIAGSQTTSHMNYSIWKQEVDIQRDELNARLVNAEVEFQCECQLKVLELQLKESEECSLTHCIDLLNKQMEYMHTMQQFGGSGDPDSLFADFIPSSGPRAHPPVMYLSPL